MNREAFNPSAFAAQSAREASLTTARSRVGHMSNHAFTRGCRCFDCETKILQAMRDHGGHFASRLAEAWFRADSGNSARLRKAFPDLLTKYEQLAELKANCEAAPE